MEKGERLVWVDNVKAVAIVLVALGHLLQGLVKSGIMGVSIGFQAFNQIIYCFHVPLFFICSGFLYQHLTEKQNFADFGKGVLKRLIAYGVPYFVFSLITYIMKYVFSSNINSAQDERLLYTLFVNPMAPYWFLYTLFFLFLFSPIIKSKIDATIRIAVGIILYMLSAFSLLSFLPKEIFSCVNSICYYLIWFVFGMAISYFGFDKRFKKWFIVSFFLFLGLKLYSIFKMAEIGGFSLVLTFLACFGILGFVGDVYKNNKQTPIMAILSRYTMPIFLMHTIFAGGIRSVLLKIGITSLPVHLIAGLTASFALPILAGWVMEKIKLDILYRPTKYIKIK